MEIARTFERYVLNAGTVDSSKNLVETNISSEPAEIQAICNAVWTSTIKNLWKDKLIADNIGIGTA